MQIGDLGEHYKPAMIQLAEQIDRGLMALYRTSQPRHDPLGWHQLYADFALARNMERLLANCGSVEAIFDGGHLGATWFPDCPLHERRQRAYRNGKLGRIGGIDTYMSQNIPLHTTGARSTDVSDDRET